MNRLQISRRFQGVISPKLALISGTAALTAFFLVSYGAQQTHDRDDLIRKSPRVSSCGASNPQIGKASFQTIQLDDETLRVAQARRDNAKLLRVKQVLPVGVELSGTITGPFAQPEAQQFELQTLSFAEANERLFSVDATYTISVVVKGEQPNLFGVSLHKPKKTTVKANTQQPIPLGVSFDTAVQGLQLVGAAKGALLVKSGITWDIATKPIPERPMLHPGKIVTDKKGVKFSGSMSGVFADFSKGKAEKSVQDVTDTSEYGPTADTYDFDLRAVSITQTLRSFGLGDSTQKDVVLSVSVDRPVKTFRLQGSAEGNRFADSGLSWGVVTTADLKRLKKIRGAQSPAQQKMLYVNDAGATRVPRTLLYVPDAQDAVIVQVGNLFTDIVDASKLLGDELLNLLKGKHAISSYSDPVSDYVCTTKTSGPLGPYDGCKDTQTAKWTTRQNGYVTSSGDGNNNAGINVNVAWKAIYAPTAAGNETFTKEVKGSKNVTITFNRDVCTAQQPVFVIYAKNGSETASTTIKYMATVTQYLPPTPQPSGSEPCPIEDKDHNGTPAPKLPTTDGTTTPIAPPTAPPTAPQP